MMVAVGHVGFNQDGCRLGQVSHAGGIGVLSLRRPVVVKWALAGRTLFKQYNVGHNRPPANNAASKQRAGQGVNIS